MRARAALMLGILASLTACLGRQRDWSRLPLRAVDLDGVARISVPADLVFRPDDTARGADDAEFVFLRVNGHHWNGMTSYAESLRVRLLAPDLDDAAVARLLRNTSPFAKDAAVRRESDGPAVWESAAFTYRRDPVSEPALAIRLTDRAAGVVLEWWGYSKHYSPESARRAVALARSRFTVTADLRAWFRSRRNWSDRPDSAEAQNLDSLAAALADLQFPPVRPGAWTRHGDWRYTIDHERPRQFHFARLIAHQPMPDAPIHLQGPLTMFRWVRNAWWQNRQHPDARDIPPDLVPGLTGEMPDPAETWFYRVHSLNLWQDRPGAANPILPELQSWMRETDAVRADFLAGKLIGRVEP